MWPGGGPSGRRPAWKSPSAPAAAVGHTPKLDSLLQGGPLHLRCDLCGLVPVERGASEPPLSRIRGRPVDVLDRHSIRRYDHDEKTGIGDQ
jgi:hypothetical protein